MNRKSPQRIQRKRTKGWRMPEGAVYVGRGSRWGNPNVANQLTVATGKRAGQKATQKDVVNIFRAQVKHALEKRPDLLAELGGKDLACWCSPDDPCHADVLLELANGAEVST